MIILNSPISSSSVFNDFLSSPSMSFHLYPAANLLQTSVLLGTDCWNQLRVSLSLLFSLGPPICYPHKHPWNHGEANVKISHHVNLFNALSLLLRNHLSSLVKIGVFWPLANSATSLWAFCKYLNLHILVFFHFSGQPYTSSSTHVVPLSSCPPYLVNSPSFFKTRLEKEEKEGRKGRRKVGSNKRKRSIASAEKL